jgi:radical SAM superfamily enzyme YgiQ (UPF0313 family)
MARIRETMKPPRRRVPVYCVYRTTGHPPLALGMIVAFAKIYKNGLLNEYYEFIPGYISTLKMMMEGAAKHGPGIFLCSDYLWSSEQNGEISKFAKAFYPSSITVHGGPSAPKYDYDCETFCEDHPYVDIVARGAGEATTAELLEHLALHGADYANGNRAFLSAVAGITFRDGGDGRTGTLVRTADRPVDRNLDAFPSPYLTGEFRNEDAADWRAAIVETNRGCPYGCTFCDWGSATLSKIRQFSLERVAAEIEWTAKNGIEILWIADANFGIFPRDVDIARLVADCHRKHSFPKQVIVNYAKNATERIARIVGILHNAGITVDGIISIQTRDPHTLEIIDRSNISTERYEDLIEIFTGHKLPISTDLMVGLPGSTPESFQADLQFFFDRGVTVKCYSTVMLPNSPMAHRDYRKRYQIEIDSDNRLVATYSYSRADLQTMKRLSKLYAAAVEASALKYLLVQMQLDHGVPAVEVLAKLGDEMDRDPASLPHSCALLAAYPAALAGRSGEQWRSFYTEIGNFVELHFGVDPKQLETVLRVQQNIMPSGGRSFPESVMLGQDFVAYYAAVRSARNLKTLGASKPMALADYGPGALQISDPDDLCGANSHRVELSYDRHRIEWELTSSLMAERVSGLEPAPSA